MLEDETIDKFNLRLRDFDNNSFAISENMLQKKLVINIMRSITKKFNTTEEEQKVSIMKVDEFLAPCSPFRWPFMTNLRRRYNG